MQKIALYEKLRNIPLDRKARALVSLMIKKLNIRSSGLFLAELEKKANALANILNTIEVSLSKQ